MKRVSITALVDAFQAWGVGPDMQVSFEDESGREYKFAEVYVHPREDRYVVVLESPEGR